VKLTFSALVSGMSGKSSDLVAASWKGVPYVRRRVVPKNPNSAAQQTQRGRMARQAAWWRSLPSALKSFIDDLAVGQGMSGFNLSTHANLDALIASLAPPICPGNPSINPIADLADATSTTDGEIDVTWSQASAPDGSYVHGFSCPVDPDEVDKVQPDIWTYHEAVVVAVATEAASWPQFKIAKDYYVVAILGDTDDITTCTKLSGGVAITATSGETP